MPSILRPKKGMIEFTEIYQNYGWCPSCEKRPPYKNWVEDKKKDLNIVQHAATISN